MIDSNKVQLINLSQSGRQEAFKDKGLIIALCYRPLQDGHELTSISRNKEGIKGLQSCGSVAPAGLAGKPPKRDRVQTEVTDVVNGCFLTARVGTQSGRVHFHN